MIKINKKHFALIFILALICAAFFGCNETTIVESVTFLDKNIVLLVGESFEPNVEVYPTYSSGYTLSSSNRAVANIVDGKINAVGEGSAVIRVKANSNELVEDVMTIKVLPESVTLDAPTITYNKNNQTINFNPVDYAATYTLKINNIEIELGNFCSYSLKQFNYEHGNAYNQTLSVQVRANAPTYSRAYISSQYSSAKTIYQVEDIQNAKIVGGVLSFDKETNVDYSLKINNEPLIEEGLVSGVVLNNINSKFAGQNATITLEASRDVGEVDYFNPAKVELPVYVLDSPSNIDLVNTVVKWNNVLNATTYALSLNGNPLTNVNSNLVDLCELPENKYNEILTEEYALSIAPIIDDTSENIVCTNKNSQITISRKQTPTPQLGNNKITFDGATSFEITLSYGERTEIITTSFNEFNLDGYEGGEYKFSIKAVGGRQGDVFYLPSFETEQITITKQSKVVLTHENVANKILTFACEDGHNFKVFVDEETNVFEGTNLSGSFKVDLSEYDFAPGEHTIFVRQLGNGNNIFDGETTSLNFVQLEKIENSSINISNSTASIERSVTNQNANITFVVKNQTETIKQIELSQGENSALLDSENDEFFTPGEYSICVKVEGDNSTQFSAKNDENGAVVFTVLNCPEFEAVAADANVITFNKVEGAVEYNLFADSEPLEYSMNLEKFSATIELENGQTKVFKVKSVGDGSSTLNSKFSQPVSLHRVLAPNVQFDAATNKLEVSNSNPENVLNINPYTAKLNSQIVNYSDELMLVEGTNYVEIFTNAVGLFEGVYNLNSQTENVEIEKIKALSTFTILDSHKLKITPTDTENRYPLYVEIAFDGQTYKFSETENKLVCAEHEISLNLEYSEGCYIVDLQKDYSSLIPASTSFEFKVKYLPNKEFVASSDFCEQTISFLQKSTLSREGQNIVMSNIMADRDVQQYALIINSQFVQILEATKSELTILVDISLIKDYLTEEVNTIRAITLNFEEEDAEPLTIAASSNEIKVKLAQSLILTSSKDNTSENNSVKIQFDEDTSEYAHTYLVEAHDENDDLIFSIPLTSEQLDGGKYVFDLDEYLDKVEKAISTVKVTAYVLTSGSISDGSVFVFNSPESNSLNFEVVAEPIDVRVEDNVLTFAKSTSKEVRGYDVYAEIDGRFEKINSTLITGTTFDLSGHEGMFSKLKIRSIALDNVFGFTNSQMKNEISVIKLSKPTIEIENGDVVITLPSEAVDVKGTICINIQNGDSTLLVDLTNSSIASKIGNQKYKIEPHEFLKYNISDNLIDNVEQVKFQVCIDAEEEGLFYLNSDFETIDLRGIFKPTTLNALAEDGIEQLTWQENTQNNINGEDFTVGYVLMLQYNGVTYYSSDSKLVYKEGDSLLPYPAIIYGTSVKFPYGYAPNLEGKCDVVFASGSYVIGVKAVPASVNNHNLCASDYITLNKKIMSAPTITVQDGTLTWNTNKDVQEYVVRIYSYPFETVLDSFVIENTSTTAVFDFGNSKFDDYSGVYGIKIQATSKDENVLNSIATDMIYVYRLPKIEKAYLDDGSLVISASPLFSFAELEFVKNGQKTKFTLNNSTKANEYLRGLGISSWKDIANTANSVIKPKNFIVQLIDGSTILPIVEGGLYELNVKFLGGDVGGTLNEKSLIIINSATAKPNLNINKIKTNKTDINKGEYIFNVNEFNSDSKFNHQFGSQDNGEFIKNAPIFIINLTASTTTQIYAIDYNYFVKNSSSLSPSDYSVVEVNGLYAYFKLEIQTGESSTTLYFNIFKDNTINLNNSTLSYYPISLTIDKDDNLQYSSQGEVSSLNLTEGGIFSLFTTILGGDSDISTLESYASSNVSETKTFLRYKTISLTGEDGLIKFENLQQPVNGKLVDYPVYELRIEPNNLSQTKYVYLYYQGNYYNGESALSYAQKIATEKGVISSASFAEITEANISGNYILFDLAPMLESLNYVIRIRTSAGLGLGESAEEAKLLLDSREDSMPVPFYKLDSIKDFALTNGELCATIVLDNSTENRNKIYDYELTISESTTNRTFVFRINLLTDSNVRIDGNKFYYVLPTNLTFNSKNFNLTFTNTYSIKIRAMAGENFALLNADYTSTIDASKLQSVLAGNVKVENGMLKWTLPASYQNARVRLKIVVDGTHVILIETSNTYFEFGDSGYAVNGNTIVIDGTQSISVQLMILGNSSAISGDYSAAKEIERLIRVDADSIVANDGVLSWQENEKAAGYKLTLTSSQGTHTYTTTYNYIDFGTTPDDDGKYLSSTEEFAVSIVTLGDEYINSMTRQKTNQTFKQLQEVEKNSIKLIGEELVFDAVLNAGGYKIAINNGRFELLTGNSNTRYKLPNSVSGEFTVKIQAVSIGQNNLFNSNVISYVSKNERPESTGEIKYNPTLNAFYWQAEKLATDEFVVQYDFGEYYLLASERATKPVVSVSTSDVKTYSDGGSTYYYFMPTVMGEYSNLKVYVSRAGVYSMPTTYSQQVILNMFSMGAGSEENPYIINSEQELLNICLKPSCAFKLNKRLDLSSRYSEIASRITSGYVIAENFSGSLDGGGEYAYAIILPQIQLENVSAFALFKTLKNAKISNLTIGTVAQTQITASYNPTSGTSKIALACLASESQTSTISNVTIQNLQIEVKQTSSSGSLAAALYIAGLTAQDDGSTISNCKVTANIIYNIKTTNASRYVAGLVADAKNTIINWSSNASTTVNLTVSTTSTIRISRLGGVVASFVADKENCGITNANASVNFQSVNASYEAGLVGYASNISLTNCVVGGKINETLSQKIDIGGFVGYASDVKISNSNCNIAFSLSTVSTSTDIHVGVVAGSLTGSGSVVGCHTNTTIVEQTILQSDGTVKLGKYSYSTIGNVECSN